MARENQLAENYSKQGIAEENYPIYGTNFWGGSPENNYGFGTSDISRNIQNVTNQLNNSTNIGQVFANSDYTVNTESLVGKPSSYFQNSNSVFANNNTSNLGNNNTSSTNTTIGQPSNKIQSNTSNDIPRYWENSVDGKKVYDYMMQQEGNFTQPIQRPELYQYSAFSAVPNMIQNYFKLKPLNVTDKYKHAYMNCSAAQYGQGGADMATLASNLREWYDKKSGANTLDSSEGDQYANRIGIFLGSKYPEEDCDELIQRYINRRY